MATSETTQTPREIILPQDTNPELLREYVAEALEHLRAAEAALLDLELHPDDPKPLHTVFRAFHSIKSSSGFLGLDAIQSLSHHAESLLDRVRRGEVQLTDRYADLALQACDILKRMLLSLRALSPGTPMPSFQDCATLARRLAEAAQPTEGACAARPPVPRLGDLLVAKGIVRRETIEGAAEHQGSLPLGQTLLEAGAASVSQVAQALRAQKEFRTPAGDAAGDGAARVPVEHIDQLVVLVGKLSACHAAMAREVNGQAAASPSLTRHLVGAGAVLRDLQALACAFHLIPLTTTFRRMARLVRDLAHKTGKAVELVTRGHRTAVHRDLLEAIADPLTHLVRNAVDHGIEPLEERRRLGKRLTGTVRLSARQDGQALLLEVSDDGRGLDLPRIAAHAARQGRRRKDGALTDREALDLICQPGFSTAERVTDLSGRGVGLDVVKARVEGLGGRLRMRSRLGQGTTFTLRLPLARPLTDPPRLPAA